MYVANSINDWFRSTRILVNISDLRVYFGHWIKLINYLGSVQKSNCISISVLTESSLIFARNQLL